MNRDAVQNERGPRTSTIRKHLATLQAKNKLGFPTSSVPVSVQGMGLPSGIPRPLNFHPYANASINPVNHVNFGLLQSALETIAQQRQQLTAPNFDSSREILHEISSSNESDNQGEICEFNFQTVGLDLGVPLNFSNFLEDILQPKIF